MSFSLPIRKSFEGDRHFRAFLVDFPSFIQAVIGIVNQMKMVDHHVRLGQRLFHRPKQKPVHIDRHFPDLLLLLLWDAVQKPMERLLPGIGQDGQGGMSAQVGHRVNKLWASKTMVINPQGELPGRLFPSEGLLRVNSPHQDPPRHPGAYPFLLREAAKTSAPQTPHDLAFYFLCPSLPGGNKGR